MRTAEEILRKQEVHQINIGGIVYEMVKFTQANKAINEARKEAIEECAKSAKIKWFDIKYDEEKRDMICEPEIDKQSILSLIDELK